MGIIGSDMQRMVERQRLGFVATVCPDGTPNLSPKGTVAVWDDDHLIFADIRSPRTVRNLATNPAVEINVVDPIARKGYRFKGTGTVIREGDGPLYDDAVALFRRRGTQSPIRSVVLVAIARALPVISPAYDTGATEDEVRTRWRRYWSAIEHDDDTAPASD